MYAQDPNYPPQQQGYGQQQPMYGQQQPMYGQQQPMPQQGYQQQPMYAQPVPQQQQPMYAQQVPQQQPQYQAQPVPQQHQQQRQPVPNYQDQANNQMDPNWNVQKEANGGRFGYESPKVKYQDPVFALLFLAHLIAIIALAFNYGPDMVKEMRGDNGSGGTLNKHGAKVILIMIGTSVVGGVFAAVYLSLIQKYVDQIIKISVGINFAFMMFFALMFLAYGSVVGFIIMLILALLSLLYFYLVRRRIPLAQAMIGASSRAIQDHSGAIWIAYAMVFVDIVWMALWAFTTVSIYYALDPEGEEEAGNNGGNFLYFCLLVSLYWSSQVFKNVSHVTTAGTVASWWFQPGEPSPTKGAFKRAATTSFGSICLGSLIVAVLQALREMARNAQRDARRDGDAAAAILACLLHCMVSCIERMVRFFNKYAYTMVAIYGLSYVQAAKGTWALFQSRGLEILINDDLTGMVLALGSLAAGACSGALGLIWAAGAGMDAYWVFGIVGFLLGFAVCALVMSVVDSAVATTYVVWAEDPQAISEGRPQEYEKIRAAAQALHPNLRF